MPLPFRSLLLAAGLGLALGGGAWAQEEPAEGDLPALEDAILDPGPAVEVPAEEAPAEEAAAPDASTAEGGPVEPTDATDGADAAAPDASGNTADDPAPAAEPAGDATAGEAAAPPAVTFDGPIIGQPVANGVNWQTAVSDIAEDARWLDTTINWVMLVIVLLVTALLLVVIYRYDHRRNPTPARFTHNSPLEITWTVVPIIILVFIGAFSLPVLFEQQEIPEGDVHVTVTGGDVIHSWKVPAFGVMQDAVPGRLAHLWFNAGAEGTYFGQCSELCGKDHAFMPITVQVVSPEEYEAWVAQAQAEFPAG
jgi:cytochrome c oxidase subunit 2